MKKLFTLALLSIFAFVAVAQEKVVVLDKTGSVDEVKIKRSETGSYLETIHIAAKYGHYKDESGSFTIFLKDKNENNIFNDVGTDEIGLCQYGTDTFPAIFEGRTMTSIEGKNYIEINSQVYELTQISPAGDTILINPVTSSMVTPKLKMVDKLPTVNVKLLDGTEKSFQDFANQGKYIYVEFWGAWCHACIKLIPELDVLQKTYGDKLTIISLNFKDDTESIKQFTAANNMTWLQAIATKTTNREFVQSQSGFPYGALFAPDGSVVKH